MTLYRHIEDHHTGASHSISNFRIFLDHPKNSRPAWKDRLGEMILLIRHLTGNQPYLLQYASLCREAHM